MSSFCDYVYSFAKKLQSQTVSSEKRQKTLLYKKAAYRMLVKLTKAVVLNLLMSAYP